MTRENALTSTILGRSALLLGFFLQGCMVGPRYKAPTPALSPFHNRVDAPPTNDKPAVGLDRWWEGFHDPVLVALVKRALDQNLDLAASVTRLDQARAAATGAGALLRPAGEFGASTNLQRQSLRGNLGTIAKDVPTFRRDIHEFAVGPAASWELDGAGGLRRGALASREEAEAADADRIGVQVSVAADVADAYFQIRSYQARLVVANNQISTDERLAQLVQNRYTAGAATRREIEQAGALLKQARSTVPMLHYGLERQLNRIDVLMGSQPGTYAKELEQPTEIPPIPQMPRDQQPTDLLRRRPDVIAAERRLAASSERIGIAIASYYPKISLAGVFGFDSLDASHLFSGAAFQPAGLFGLRWRLFDFGRVDAEVARARGANAEALVIYRQALLRAAEDVENALSLLGESQALVGELQGQVQSLNRARDLSETAYRAGSIPLTDVLIADRDLLTAQYQLNTERAGVARAAVAVFRALGGGWEPPI